MFVEPSDIQCLGVEASQCIDPLNAKGSGSLPPLQITQLDVSLASVNICSQVRSSIHCSAERSCLLGRYFSHFYKCYRLVLKYKDGFCFLYHSYAKNRTLPINL